MPQINLERGIEVRSFAPLQDDLFWQSRGQIGDGYQHDLRRFEWVVLYARARSGDRRCRSGSGAGPFGG